MILWALILIPLLAAPLAWYAEVRSRNAPRWLAIGALTLDLLIAWSVWGQDRALLAADGRWLLETQAAWIPRWGIGLHLGLDGLSLVLILLTAFLGLVAVVSSAIVGLVFGTYPARRAAALEPIRAIAHE